MNPSCPISCREEAARQGRLANEEQRLGNFKAVRTHIERARVLALLAIQLEAEAAREQQQP